MSKIKSENKSETGFLFRSVKPDFEINKAIKFWLWVIPVYLIFCSSMVILFNLHLHLFDLLNDLTKSVGQRITGQFFLPMILFGVPSALLIINMLAILEMYYDSDKKEVRIRVKEKPFKILIVLLSILALGLFVVYWLTQEQYN